MYFSFYRGILLVIFYSYKIRCVCIEVERALFNCGSIITTGAQAFLSLFYLPQGPLFPVHGHLNAFLFTAESTLSSTRAF
jgi:hypothetical protein